MFPRSKRLTRGRFGPATRRARRFSTEHFSLSLPHEGAGYAVVVSKTVSKSSVARHRVKRRIIGALKTLTLPEGAIIYAKKGAPELTFGQTKEELRALMSQC